MFYIIKQSLWDLKPNNNGKYEEFIRIIKQSLWDLKQGVRNNERINQNYYKAVPMGFETIV